MRSPSRLGALMWPASAAIVVLVALIVLRSVGETAARIDAASAAVKPTALTDPAAARYALTTTKPLPAVMTAVRAAERSAPLPSPLTPPVNNLRRDFYHFPDGCTPAKSESKSKKICRLGVANSGKTIVVIGDSHAEMWMATILKMAVHDGWVVVPFVKVSCIPRRWFGSGVCGDWYRWAKAHAAALHPDVTLIADSWTATWSPESAIVPVQTLSRAMKRSSASVIVVGDAPSQSRDPIDCLLDQHSNMRTCTAVVHPEQLKTDRAIETNARKDGVGFMNTRGWFCGHPRPSDSTLFCPMVVNKTITAVDRGHISKTYSLELFPSFRNSFRTELFR